MQKIIGIIVSIIVIAGCITGVAFLINGFRGDNKEYSLTVSTSEGGKILMKIDDDDHTITHDANEIFKVKNSTNIKLVAEEFEGYEFIKWTLNNEDKSSDAEITIKISENSTINAIFAPETVNVTINNGTITEDFDYELTSNLLYTLNTKYPAPAGYKHSFKINDTVIDENTTISEDTVITLEKTIIEYTVTFKHNNEQFGEIQTYTVENKNINVPNAPVENGYTIVWDDFTLDNLGNIVVNSVPTLIDYNIEFYLPEGYTFADGTNNVKVVYQITDNYEGITKPILTNIENIPEHYTMVWPEDVTLNYSDSVVIVNADLDPIKYSITFKFNDEESEVKYFSIEDKNVVAPSIDAIQHYKDLSWNAFDTNLLENQIVTLNKTPIDYTVTFNDGINEPIVRTYNIENMSISDVPELPKIEHYTDIKWTEYDLSTLTNIDVTIEKTPIEYNVKFILDNGYTFEDGTTEIVLTYTVENPTVENPTLPTPRAGYELKWSDYKIQPIGVELEIHSLESAIKYPVTFMHEGVQYGDIQYYTVEECNIYAPAVPVKEGYYVAWPKLSIDPNKMESVVINSIILTKIKTNVNLTINHIDHYNKGNYIYSTLYIAEGKAYATLLADAKQVYEITDLATRLDSCITNSLGNQAKVSQIIVHKDPTPTVIDVNDDLSAKLTEAFGKCDSSAVTITFVYSAK